MPVLVQCPSPACRASCSVADAVSGGPVRCPKCGKPFLVGPTVELQKRDTKDSRPASAGSPFPSLPAEFGRYRVLKLLGQGGMGAVYLAEDSQLGRQVALKLPFFGPSGASQRIERFVREARSAAALHHPNICTVFDAGQIDGRPFLTMAHVSGAPLTGQIDPERPMPQRRAAEIVRKVALALEQAHRKGVVHRDLKPANVMLSADGEPVVTDFGLAKRVGDGEANEAKLTQDGGIVGTPAYMSPEQVRGEAVGPATDVYSLGALLFELLTGRPPYTGKVGAVLGQVLAAPVPPVRELRPDVDARLDAICRKAMAKVPAERFASMAEVANALGLYLEASSAPPAQLAAPAPRAPAPAVDRSPFDGLVEAKPAPGPKKAKWGRAVAVALALAVLAPLGVWLAVVLLRVQTPNGTLVVEVNDDEVEARLKNGKLVLSGPDGKVRYTLTASERNKKLKAGEYRIHVEGADGLVLDTTEFTLKKGKTVVVRVTAERKAVAKKETPDKTKAPKKGDVITNSIGMKLIYVPPGKFSMGSPKDEPGRREDEGPEHEVEITKGFYMGVYEVTQRQFREIMGYNPSYFSSDGKGENGVNYLYKPGKGKGLVKGMDTDDFPVENVSSREAKAFLEKLSALKDEEGKKRKYRLPTEAEWEYACRGGLSPSHPFNVEGRSSDSLSSKQANFNGNEPYGGGQKGQFLGRTCKVGSYKPNGFGLYDMHGNIWELCADWYDKDYYKNSPRRDPSGPSSGTIWVFRGGCCNTPGHRCRSAARDPFPQGDKRDRDASTGFRVVLDPSATAYEEETPLPATAFEPDVPASVAAAAALQALRRDKVPAEALALAGDGDAKRAPTGLVGVLGEAEPVHTDLIRCLAFSADGRWLASASFDKTILLRDVVSGRVKRVLKGHTSWVMSVAFSKDGGTLVSAGHDGTLKLWPVDKATKPQTLEPKLGEIWGMAVSADGRFLAAGGTNGGVKIWKWGQWDKPIELPVAAGKSWIHFNGNRNASLAFSPDGEWLAVARDEMLPLAPIRLYKTADGKLADTLPGDKAAPLDLTFSPDGKSLASFVQDRGAYVWEVASRKHVAEFPAVQFGSVAFSKDGKSLAVAGRWHVALYDVASRKKKQVLPAGHGTCFTLAFSPDGKLLASAFTTGIVHVWETAGWKEQYLERGHLRYVRALAVSPDGGTLLTAGDDDTLRRWDLARPGANRALHLFRADDLYTGPTPQGGASVASGPDGRSFALVVRGDGYSGGPPVMSVWDAATSKSRWSAPLYLESIAFSPDSKTVAGACQDRSIRLWDTADGKEVHRFGQLAVASGLAFSGDGKLLAAASQENEGRVLVWNVASGAEVHSWKDTPMTVAAFRPAGRILATGHADGTIGIWDLDEGKKKRTLKGHSAKVQSLKFTPDGKTLVSSAQDGTIRLWGPDQERARQIIAVGPANQRLVMDLDPSGKYVFAAGHSPVIFILRLP